MSLRNKVIKLAHEKPELREHLLPLVTKSAGAKNIYAELVIELVPYWLFTKDIKIVSSITMIEFRDTEEYTHINAIIHGKKGTLSFHAIKGSYGAHPSIAQRKGIVMDLMTETKSSIGKKIAQYLKSL